MRTARPRSLRGATIVEALMAAATFTLMLSGLVAIGKGALSTWSYGSSKMTADNDASLVMQQLVNDVRRGIRAYVTSTNNQLTVVLPAVNNQGDYIRTAEGSSIRYYLLNGSLYRQEGTAAAVVVGRKITAIKYAVDGEEVEITVTARQQNGSNEGKTTLKSQTTMRNPSF